jgi:two-component system, CitB family, sensor kinase
VVCERRGGAVSVHAGADGTGAVFEARLPGVGAGVETR